MPDRLADDCRAICFQILYGLPEELQFRAAIHMAERYLPIHEKKWPDVTWPRTILADLDAWFRAEGEATPDEPADIDMADLTYEAHFTDLLCAYRYRNDPVCLTAGTCAMILGVIHARARNVFLADDPVADRLKKEKRAWDLIDEEDRPPEPSHFLDLWKPEHRSHDNVAFQTVFRRECLHVVEWLRAEAVWKYPEPDDLDTMMRGLKRWEDAWCYSIGPERAEGKPPPDDTPE